VVGRAPAQRRRIEFRQASSCLHHRLISPQSHEGHKEAESKFDSQVMRIHPDSSAFFVIFVALW
jgi:hypothetical protein